VKKIISWIRSKKFILLSILFCLLEIINLPLQSCYKPYLSKSLTDVDTLKIQVLSPVDNIKATIGQVREHNDKLRELLFQKINNEYSSSNSRESSHQQTRGFYVLIIIGLLSISLTKPNVKILSSILCALILVMYVLEVHELDLNERYTVASRTYSRQVDTLTNYLSNSTNWYVFSNKPIYDWMNRESDFGNRLNRKLIKAVFLYDADQLVLYIIPLTIIFLWSIRNRNIKNPSPPNYLIKRRLSRNN
jgi:hypothetical protein